MKVVILAGGYGSRLDEETNKIPKPLVKINNIPIIVHIMKIFSHYGFNDFIILTGYKSELIKDYFLNFNKNNYNVKINLKKNTYNFFKEAPDWKINIVYTGLNTMTGGRLKKIQKYILDENFLMTYGDGICDLPINKLVEFHKKHKKLATVTAVEPPGRYGVLKINKNTVSSFEEKISFSNFYINGGFFVLNKGIFKYIKDNKTIWEETPMKNLVKKNQLAAFKYKGFWKSMDTLKDKRELEKIFLNKNFFLNKM